MKVWVEVEVSADAFATQEDMAKIFRDALQGNHEYFDVSLDRQVSIQIEVGEISEIVLFSVR